MQIFRDIVAAGQTPVIRTYPKTYNRRTNREMVAIYPKPARRRN